MSLRLSCARVVAAGGLWTLALASFGTTASAQTIESAPVGPLSNGAISTAPPPNGDTRMSAAPTWAPPPVYGPKTLPYEVGDPVPVGYHVSERTRTGLIVGGAIPFGIFWMFSALAASIEDGVSSSSRTRELWPLYVPAVGPFMALGTSNPRDSGVFWLMLDGVVQTGGLAMLIVGIVHPQPILRRNDAALAPRLAVLPMHLGREGTGLSLVGSF